MLNFIQKAIIWFLILIFSLTVVFFIAIQTDKYFANQEAKYRQQACNAQMLNPEVSVQPACE